jgi:hypothetical protein
MWPTTGRVVGRPKVTWREPTTKRNQPPRQTILYVPLPGFWLPGSGLWCRCVLQSVANCFRCRVTLETVADCSQTVAICCNTRKSVDSVSRCVCAIPFLNEGAIRQHRWTRIHRRAAEKQVRTWSTCAPSFRCNLPRARDRLPGLGERLKLGW